MLAPGAAPTWTPTLADSLRRGHHGGPLMSRRLRLPARRHGTSPTGGARDFLDADERMGGVPGRQPRRASYFDGGGELRRDRLPAPRASRGLTLRLFDPEREQWSLYWVQQPQPACCSRRWSAASPTARGRVLRRRHPRRARTSGAGSSGRTSATTTARWEQAFSVDGGETWVTNWIMDFTSAPPFRNARSVNTGSGRGPVLVGQCRQAGGEPSASGSPGGSGRTSRAAGRRRYGGGCGPAPGPGNGPARPGPGRCRRRRTRRAARRPGAGRGGREDRTTSMSLPTSCEAALSTVVTYTPPGRSTRAHSATIGRDIRRARRARCSSHTLLTASNSPSRKGSRAAVGEHDRAGQPGGGHAGPCAGAGPAPGHPQAGRGRPRAGG